MRSVSIVIGANWGDEGKGLVTDWLAAKGNNPLVVRHNGGAQAGHTVVTPDGRRHVFHHFGSGALAGAPTYLSRFFVAHPMFFARELAEIESLGANYFVGIDPQAMVTTPYDVMLNQAAERARGDDRHGSCGMGFNETVHRNENAPFICQLRFENLGCVSDLRLRLERIRDHWVPFRAEQLGIAGEIEFLKDDRVFERFLKDCDFMVRKVDARAWRYLKWDGDLVFEGAQGLRLDMNHSGFPHVTRSNTGIKNAMALLADIHFFDAPDVYYITRTYLTRHGAGPLPRETDGVPYEGVRDQTNVPNDHQGALRYGWLEIDKLVSEIRRDMLGYRVNPIPVVTCADQSNDRVKFIDEGFDAELDLDVNEFAYTLSTLIDGKKCVVSRGPTRRTMMEYENARFDDQRVTNEPALDDKIQPGFQVFSAHS